MYPSVRRIGLLGPEITTSLITAFVICRLDYSNAAEFACLRNFQSRQLLSCNGWPAERSNGNWPAWSRDPNSSTAPLVTHNSSNYYNCAFSGISCIPDAAAAAHRIYLQLHDDCNILHVLSSSPSATVQRFEASRTKLKFGERCFSLARSSAWNTLPVYLQK